MWGGCLAHYRLVRSSRIVRHLSFTLTCLTSEIQQWVSQLRSGDPRALARAISLVENHTPGWLDLLKTLFPYTGNPPTTALTRPPTPITHTLLIHLHLPSLT